MFKRKEATGVFKKGNYLFIIYRITCKDRLFNVIYYFFNERNVYQMKIFRGKKEKKALKRRKKNEIISFVYLYIFFSRD